MYTVTKRLEIAGAHRLNLDYESKCNNLHGHNWIIYITCKSKNLNKNGMVIDFKTISTMVKNRLDHAYLNEVVEGVNPTAENIAKWICDLVPYCVKVSVRESEGNTAIYEREIFSK